MQHQWNFHRPDHNLDFLAIEEYQASNAAEFLDPTHVLPWQTDPAKAIKTIILIIQGICALRCEKKMNS